MKIITLYEPWASLIARGFKKWETRGWPTSYRGWVAIHAGKNRNHVDDLGFLLVAAGVKKSIFDPDPFPANWPFGCIVAAADLVDCVPTEKVTPSAQERAFGDYSPGRFAWIFGVVRRTKPLLFRGIPGLKDLPLATELALEYFDKANVTV